MRKTYIIEITSTDAERDAYIKAEGLNMNNGRFHNDEEAQNFVDGLNKTDTFKYYKQTARIIRII